MRVSLESRAKHSEDLTPTKEPQVHSSLTTNFASSLVGQVPALSERHLDSAGGVDSLKRAALDGFEGEDSGALRYGFASRYASRTDRSAFGGSIAGR